MMLRTHRASAYESLRKWDIFRERREAEIDRYVSARRRQARAERARAQERERDEREGLSHFEALQAINIEAAL